jgi:hypothetical protein
MLPDLRRRVTSSELLLHHVAGAELWLRSNDKVARFTC